MDETRLKQLMRQNCTAVFATMLEASILEISAERATTLDTEERIVSLIGFGGDHTGNCMITCCIRDADGAISGGDRGSDGCIRRNSEHDLWKRLQKLNR